ncbi:MAG: hypothetical protein HQL51_09080 [Magnetococcales bacterium]|nr:hypothetical protein [Magnetococcales bacterium]
MARNFPAQHGSLPEEIRERYGERAGRFADAKSSEGRRRLEVAAVDLWILVKRFQEDEIVRETPEYHLLERLLAEQCTVGEGDGGDPPVWF